MIRRAFNVLIFLSTIVLEFSTSSEKQFEKIFPILELPKELDRAFDPAVTTGLPTVVVRGFLNYMTVVDGVVIKFTKSTETKPAQSTEFPVLLIPTSVETISTVIKATRSNSFNDTEIIVELNKKTGHIHHSSSAVSNQSQHLRNSTNDAQTSLTTSEKLRMRMNRFKLRGADSDQVYDICLKDVCVRGKIPDSVLLVGRHKHLRKHDNTVSAKNHQNIGYSDLGYTPPLPKRRRRKLLRKRVKPQPEEKMYIESKFYSTTRKSQILSTISVVKDGATMSHVITDQFVITELITAHKAMPNYLRTKILNENKNMIRESPSQTSIKPTSVSPGNFLTASPLNGMINPVEYLVSHGMEPTNPSTSESDLNSSQSSFSTPPLPLPPPFK